MPRKRMYIVHLARDDDKTLCGAQRGIGGHQTGGVPTLPEGDYLSPCERLCFRCEVVRDMRTASPTETEEVER